MGTEILISFGILIGFHKNRTTWYTAGSTTDIGPNLAYSNECFIVLRILRHSKELNHQDGTLLLTVNKAFPDSELLEGTSAVRLLRKKKKT